MMPPKAKITRDMILQTVLEITRESDFAAVNARSIAGKLLCSTRPIFTCYDNMEELKKEFLDFAYAYYEQYVSRYQQTGEVDPSLVWPLSYLAFAQEETPLFKLLFITEMDLEMTSPKDFYKEPGNQEKAERFAKTIGVGLEQAKDIFLDIFLYAHGMAVLTATQKMALDRSSAENRLRHMLTALIEAEKSDGSYEEIKGSERV